MACATYELLLGLSIFHVSTYSLLELERAVWPHDKDQEVVKHSLEIIKKRLDDHLL